MQPEVDLQRDEQAQIVALIAMPGFAILKDKVMKLLCDKFIRDLINADGADEAAVIDRHKKAKAAAQFFALLIDVINQIRSDYSMQESVKKDKAKDFTEGTLNIDAFDGLEDLPNILGGENE
jgi:hypothetical protein